MQHHFPDPDLAAALLPHAFDVTDGAHDHAHLLRVWRNVVRIAAVEGGDLVLLQAATLLHDCIYIPKDSPKRATASRLAACKANEVLLALGWSEGRVSQVCHAIETHSFSAGLPPETLEAKILQDADRLDAVGWIGVARCLWIAGDRGAALYDPQDPRAEHRALDDASFALDHFQSKLLGLGKGMQTATGRALATERVAHLRQFYEGLMTEVAV